MRGRNGRLRQTKEPVMPHSYASELSTKSIADQNDAFRSCPGPDWNMTSSVLALGPEFLIEAVRKVTRFSTFSEDNDPHGEHDFGAFELQGERLFWKIDYYDKTVSAGSPDPANPGVTRRVMTIMLASDY
jgi:hypothetical protein